MKNLVNSIESIQAALVTDTSDLINYSNQAFYDWQSGRLGNDLFINEPERAARIHEAAECGADGSTHGEHISDFQEYADEHYEALTVAAWRLDLPEKESLALDSMIEAAQEKLDKSIADLETWHDKNGTLHNEVG